MRGTILDLCGGTGAWSKAYADAGYKVQIITLPEWDVIEYLRQLKAMFKGGGLKSVRGVLIAAPCTEFSGSGAQYWPAKDADGRTAAALAVVDACLDIKDLVKPDWWALEQPVGRLRKLRGDRLGPLVLQFDPFKYGDPYTKRTQLFGQFNLPKENLVEPIRANKQGSWLQSLGGKSAKTKLLRSVTPPGFAKAFFEANR